MKKFDISERVVWAIVMICVAVVLCFNSNCLSDQMRYEHIERMQRNAH